MAARRDDRMQHPPARHPSFDRGSVSRDDREAAFGQRERVDSPIEALEISELTLHTAQFGIESAAPRVVERLSTRGRPWEPDASR